MECLTVQNTLSDYIDGGLPATDANQIAGHLNQCDGCHSLELQLTELRSAARDLPLHTPSKALWTRISNVIESEGLIADPRATRPMKKETLLDRLREAWAALSLPQMAGAGVLAALLVTVVGIGFYRQFNHVVSIDGIQANVLPEESKLKGDLDRKLDALKSKMTGWDAQQRTAFEGDLQRIEKNIESTRTQLAAQPQNAEMIEQLRKLYAEKTALLDKAAQAR